MLLFSSFCAAFVSIPLFGFKLVFPYIYIFKPPFLLLQSPPLSFEDPYNGHYLRAISRSLFVRYAEEVIGLDGQATYMALYKVVSGQNQQ